jgi:hypothetical protein
MSADRTLQLERQAEANRARLASTLDELSGNLTPGRMLDEVMTYARSNGTDFLKGLGNAAAANPIPALMIGAGCAMFLSGKGRVEDITSMFGAGRASGNGRTPTAYAGGDGDVSEEYLADGLTRRTHVRGKAGDGSMLDAVGSKASSAAEGISRRAAAAGAGVLDSAGRVRDSAAEAAGSAMDAIGGAAASVGSTATGLAAQAGDAADAAGQTMAEAASAAMESARAMGHDAADYAAEMTGKAGRMTADAGNAMQNLADRAARLAREQPLIAAAAGLVVGAIVAAALPRTKLEDELMGETSDAIKETIGEAASEQIGNATDAAGRVADQVMETAADTGLSAETAKEAVQELGDKIVDVASAGTRAVKEEVKATGAAGREKP